MVAIHLSTFAAIIYNDLKVITANAGNAYQDAKTTEKLYAFLGDEYGELSGRI